MSCRGMAHPFMPMPPISGVSGEAYPARNRCLNIILVGYDKCIQMPEDLKIHDHSIPIFSIQISAIIVERWWNKHHFPLSKILIALSILPVSQPPPPPQRTQTVVVPVGCPDPSKPTMFRCLPVALQCFQADKFCIFLSSIARRRTINHVTGI